MRVLSEPVHLRCAFAAGDVGIADLAPVRLELREGVTVDAPSLRVMVEEDTGEFNAKGFNVFCKFVKKADRQIRTGDDVLVVDGKDRLFAVGRAAVGSRMMTESMAGTAVKVRDGAEKH